MSLSSRRSPVLNLLMIRAPMSANVQAISRLCFVALIVCGVVPARAEEHGDEIRTADAEISQFFDVSYDDRLGKAGTCDVYLPAGDATDSLRPAVLLIHGGGWFSGDKWTMTTHCKMLARQGYVAISINYRLAPTHKFPAQVDDVRQALLWTQKQAKEYRIDLQRLGLFGYSAGGHLSALTGLLADESIERQAAASDWPVDDPRWAKLPRIKTVCIGGPPCDFRTLPPGNTSLAYFLGGSRGELPEVYKAASPAAQVSSDDPPLQIVHGAEDMVVPIATSRGLHQALTAAGVMCQLMELPGRGHVLTFIDQRTKQTMIQWFKKQL